MVLTDGLSPGTNYFMLVTTMVCFLLASVRTFEKIAWLTWGQSLPFSSSPNIITTRDVNCPTLRMELDSNHPQPASSRYMWPSLLSLSA